MRVAPTPGRASDDLVMVKVVLGRVSVLVTLLPEHVLPDPPPAWVSDDVAVPGLLLLVLTLDVL